MTDETPAKTAGKIQKTVPVVTLIPVYPEPGKAPHPIGTSLTVAAELAQFWIDRKIARAVKHDAEDIDRVGPAVDKKTKLAPLPAAPAMTPPPTQPGA